MQLPDWLSKMTGAAPFAAPGGKPNFGDGLQGIGHSMMNHYRRNSGMPGVAGPEQQDLAKAQIDEILAGLAGTPQVGQMPPPPPPMFPPAGQGFAQAPMIKGIIPGFM